MNIIILAAGEGKRFKEEGFVEPKPLIKVLTKPIINWLLDSLNISKKDNLILVLNKNHSDFRIKDCTQNQYNNLNIKFSEVNYTTRGAAETLYSCLDSIDNTDPILVLDCDTFYEEDIVNKCRSIQDNFLFYFNTSTKEPIYSYINIKENKIVEIKEKIKISNNACSGAYGFKNKVSLKDGVIDAIEWFLKNKDIVDKRFNILNK